MRGHIVFFTAVTDNAELTHNIGPYVQLLRSFSISNILYREYKEAGHHNYQTIFYIYRQQACDLHYQQVKVSSHRKKTFLSWPERSKSILIVFVDLVISPGVSLKSTFIYLPHKTRAVRRFVVQSFILQTYNSYPAIILSAPQSSSGTNVHQRQRISSSIGVGGSKACVKQFCVANLMFSTWIYAHQSCSRCRYSDR